MVDLCCMNVGFSSSSYSLHYPLFYSLVEMRYTKGTTEPWTETLICLYDFRLDKDRERNDKDRRIKEKSRDRERRERRGGDRDGNKREKERDRDRRHRSERDSGKLVVNSTLYTILISMCWIYRCVQFT